MTFFSSPFDRPIILGRGQVGSSILATAAVYRSKIANSAIGSAQMGTFSLAKAVGTLANASIGSLVLSYGSAGTHAGRFFRGQQGSFIGSLIAPVHRGRYGSFAGTIRAPRIRANSGSFGSLKVAARYSIGSVGSYTRAIGGAAAGAVSNAGSLIRGTISSHRIFLGTLGMGGSLRGDRFLQYLGTHLVTGSLSPTLSITRYAVWKAGLGFSTPNYVPFITIQERPTTPGSSVIFSAMVLSKAVGSMQYSVRVRPEANNLRQPIGSIHITAMAYPAST